MKPLAPAPAQTRLPASAPHRTGLAVWAWALSFWLCWAPTAPAAAPAAALPAVVVWDFDNQTPAALARGDAFDFLRRSLSENLTTALLQVAGLPVVERQRLKDLLAEQRVSAGELADEDARVRLGRIVGAARMVFGGFFVIGDEVQVHVRVIDTATSRVLFSDELTAPLPTVMLVKLRQNSNVALAILVTPLGIVMFVTPLSANAPMPMLVTPVGTVTLLRLPQ